MDRAFLDAYGWSHIAPTCEFLLDYEIDEDDWGDKKMPNRYRWPDDVQAEVLGHLLDPNAERAKAEDLSGAVATKRGGKKKGKKSATPGQDERREGGGLFA